MAARHNRGGRAVSVSRTTAVPEPGPQPHASPLAPAVQSSPPPPPTTAEPPDNLTITVSSAPAPIPVSDPASVPPPKPKPKLVIKLIVRPETRKVSRRVELPGFPLLQDRDEETEGGETQGEDEHERLKTIPVEDLIREEDIEAMPSLEAPLTRARKEEEKAPLTRKRRRASSVADVFVELPATKHRVNHGKKAVINGKKGKGRDVEQEEIEFVNEVMQVEAEKKGRGRKKVVKIAEEMLVNGNGTSSSSISLPKSKLKAEKLTNGIANGLLHGSSTSVPKKLKSNKEVEVHVNGIEKKAPKAKPKQSKQKEKKDKDKEALERNIDNIVFGDVTFKAWYPSWYPKEIIGEKALSCPDGKGPGITVRDLYVCRKCFGYSKVLVDWVRHCRCCEREVPGEKVYSYGEEGMWSVWEVDGGVETLFCQNLSLFAKLFLDNKSVFFDVSGFNYFLLVHTPPSAPHSPQIIGFFSKEKMSWDNNNLACILVFPPWQRKGLGALLMGVSYAIARREGIMGGPEKPISDLGKKGYKRYWGAEVARWLLAVKETDKKKGKGMVNVEKISKETWIAPDDCLMVLREMGVVEKAGRGKGTVERVRIDKARVMEWVQKERVSLDRVVDDDGFVEGYALKVEEEEEAVDEQEEGVE